MKLENACVFNKGNGDKISRYIFFNSMMKAETSISWNFLRFCSSGTEKK